jgi:hypothetical protein
MMEIIKSTRHQKIIGDYGENLINNWLSRSGFEVTIVDHTGIDIIAYHPLTEKRLGITVKSRTRTKGEEMGRVKLLNNRIDNREKKNDRQKILEACKAFACEPWIAVYVETSEFADFYLTSLKNYDKKYRGEKEKKDDDWQMKDEVKKQYEEDPDVKHVNIKFHETNWNWSR